MSDPEKISKGDWSEHDSQEKRKDIGGTKRSSMYDVEGVGTNVNAVFENPLAKVGRVELMCDVESFCQRYGLQDDVDIIKRGALVAQNPARGPEVADLKPEEIQALVDEHEKRWNHPWMLYWLTVMCSLGAATQGMDESVNNGANPIYPDELGFGNAGDVYQGAAVSAPYIACAVIGCWLNEPMNRYFGRRGTIFISCFIAAAASIWEAFTYDWGQLFGARFLLGLGIGAKSSTVPVYCAECAPERIRGALVMQWQVWTAFGIMLGNIMGVAFSPDNGIARDVAWRLMLGSTVVLPLIVCAQVYFCPESPRWLIQKGKIAKAYRSFQRIRNTDLQAGRDLYYTYVGVQLEKKINANKNLFVQLWELFSVPRNRRATLAVWIVMFGQQFCGVNVIAYYSTSVFQDAGYSLTVALLVSMGTGILNWVFALPAFFTIDTYGRRPLLAITYPFLSLTMLWTSLSFLAPNQTVRTAMVTTGMYLFEVFYSPGMGPVPFSYSAEAYPIQVRDVGMAFATATTWTFNSVLGLTWPLVNTAFTSAGGFGWWAAWCAILWILSLLFVPETKELTLEELDQVFSVPTWKHASYQMSNISWHFRRYILLQNNIEPLPPLYSGKDRLH